MSHSTIRLGQKMNFTIKDDKYEHIGLTPMVLNVDLEQNPNKTGGTKYKSCTGTYSINCKADAISTVQACVGLNPDGKFGPKTEAKLKELGYTSFKDADVTTICSKVKGEVKTPEPEVSGEDVAINTTDTNF